MAQPRIRTKVAVGHRFGRLVVTEISRGDDGRLLANAVCDCGGRTLKRVKSLLDKGAKSCGCLRSEARHQRTHGETLRKNPSAEYNSWIGMKGRCNNPNHPRWNDYGGRGITVCSKWDEDFSAFLSDMGRRPSAHHTLDRIDNNKGYEPANCRWATKQEQSSNTRRALRINLDGDLVSLREAYARTGITPATIAERRRKGCPENLLCAPLNSVRLASRAG